MAPRPAPEAPDPLPETDGLDAPRFSWTEPSDVIPLDLDERLPPVEKDVDA